ncbi:uncharacterized protein N7518_000128 [Penicillium psychrosexuale]|uniref:uncharacterized protein n=1 Tax=Penicillium psychrosexuale TaxID=1002107 RepID=UPI002544DCB1|nr:uncharacterized protein N7518_000128 [Penicillium psychrosexuale]KAJ5803825.1 hypothetical protein N7518_000128 [Penicillium psychrosexuale]
MASTSTLTIKRSRRKRPSFSPVKARQSSLPPRARSESPPPVKTGEPAINSAYCRDSSALDFNEFSLLDDDGSTPSLGEKCHDLLFEYLREHFGVEDMWVMQPFIFLRCSERPDPAQRPFTISGCLAFWLGMDDPLPTLTPGTSGGETEIDKFVHVDQNLVQDLKPYRMPKPETLLMVLVQHFPEAAAISFIFNTIIVEFDEVDEDAWRERVGSLPCSFANLALELTYSNGLLANSEWKRLISPKPADLNTLVSDDSDYIAATGFFNPGAMISSDQEDAVSAGVLVEKGSEQRLTVACHCWDREFDEKLDHLGDPNHFRVLQANSRVGYVTERIDETDIGLAKLDDTVAFSNRFLDIETAAKVLIPFTGVKTGDKFFIDSFVTGRQRLLCAGVRVLGCPRGQDFLRDRRENPPDGKYVIMHQGIYATNDTMITTAPQLRAGICGSVLVRLQRAGEESICLEDGEVCGIMHWADLAMKYSTSLKFFCFADPMDPLISNGWACVPVPEKRPRSSS